MKSVCVKKFARFFLLAAIIGTITGCGSSGSTSNSSESGTGSLAVKLTWSSAGPKTTAKTLYAAPTGVTAIRISVYSDASMATLITSKDFVATPNVAGSGTIDGIPAGDRAVKVEGLGLHSGLPGTLIYLGTAIVNVVAGQTNPPPVQIAMEAPATSASPAATPSNAPFTVTLTTAVPATIYYTTSEPATIYYTTNGDPPTINSPNFGTSPVSIPIVPPVTLKYFAWVRGLYEAIITKDYSLVP